MALPIRVRGPRESRQEDSPFFSKLPPKIRNKIYEAYRDLLLESRGSSVRFRDGLGNFGVFERRVSNYPRLLMTCKKMAKEAGAIVFTKANLRFSTPFFGGMASETLITTPGNWQPTRYQELSLELIPSWMNEGAHTMRTELQALFVQPSRTNIRKITLRFDFRNLVVSPRTDLSQIEEHTMSHFVFFARALPRLEQIELRGVFPRHWISELQSRVNERGTSVIVTGQVDPPLPGGVDAYGWLRVDENYQQLSEVDEVQEEQQLI